MPTHASESGYTADVLRGAIEAILARYRSARPGEPFGRGHDLWALFENARVAVADSDPVAARPTVKVTWSAGMGGLARVPALAFLDVRETRSARRGLHVAMLFCEDSSGVYLTLIQGAADPIARLKRAKGREALDREADRLRQRFSGLAEHGFHLDGAMDLNTQSATGVDYEHAAVAYKRYETGAIPPDATIEDDLATMLEAYTAYVTSKTDLDRVEPVTWIFRSSPKRFDLAGALAELAELTWPVRQYRDWIHEGDTVYLWQSGANAGLAGVATVASEPGDLEPEERERRFIHPEGRAVVQPRVRLRVDRVFASRFSQEELRARPRLESLGVVAGAKGTNFPVTPDEAREIERLVSGAPVPEELPVRRPRGVARRGRGVRFDVAAALHDLVHAVAARGFAFEPWQIAAYVAALRTKPFVILAGVSGTGKSRLPALVAEATGGTAHLLPVRPDWTDSSDVVGYTDLQGRFRPGPLLEIARATAADPGRHAVCVLDEMNLARVEHYFAEVLSRIEARAPAPEGGFASAPLLLQSLDAADAAWSAVGLPSNLAIVGTVNMDESTHGFSRKVLDRAFTIELSDVDLSLVEPSRPAAVAARPWPASAWTARALRLGALGPLADTEREDVARTIAALTELNGALAQAQLQVGYRTRDEIALFLLHARETAAAFVTRAGEPVDPLDLALQMKILPRIAGGSGAVRRVVLALLGWAVRGKAFTREEDADRVVDVWTAAGRQGALAKAAFPRTAARLSLMWERMLDEGFTSFWA